MRWQSWLRPGAVVAVSIALLLSGGYSVEAKKGGGGGGATPLIMHVYDSVVDEQNTTAFYNNGQEFCAGSTVPVQDSNWMGDDQLAGSSAAYGFGAPWTAVGGLVSTRYDHGDDCGNNCQRVQFDSGNKILTLDTRGTTGPRRIAVDFTDSCGLADGCPGPAGDPAVFGGLLSTDGLLNIFLDFPYLSMGVCSSTTCPEAQPAFAKFWFTDPDDSSVTWRIDWTFLRVLRMSETTWYVIADACDGTQVAGLSKLIGKRTRPKTVFNGFYKIPFFLAVELKP